MCVVTRSPCGNLAASHSLWVSARPVGETSHIATLQASATNWRTSSRPMPLPPPVTIAVLPANSVMCASLAFRGRSRYGLSLTSPPVGKRSVRAVSSGQAPPDLACELLEEIDSPCLGTSEISTGGGYGKLGWVSFAPLDDPQPAPCKPVPALCVRRVDVAELSAHSVREVRGRTRAGGWYRGADRRGLVICPMKLSTPLKLSEHNFKPAI